MIDEILVDLYKKKFISRKPENYRKEKFQGTLEDFLSKIKKVLEGKGIDKIILFSPSDPAPGTEVIFSVNKAIEFVRKSMNSGIEPPEDFILKDKNETLLICIDHTSEDFWIIYF